MSKEYSVFYSWQSDKRRSSNFISSSIEKAIKLSKRNLSEEIFLEINFDRDTRNKSGSPQIAQTIFDKISQCDIFVCDVSLINNTLLNRTFKNRITSNPNVLIELGYAINSLGWERVICVNNTEFGVNELLPFDIRAHRISSFNKKDENSRKSLIAILESGISSIIKDYQNIEERHISNELKKKDRVIFNKVSDILPESVLIDDLETICTTQYYNEFMHSKWVELRYYYSDSMNHFLSREIHSIMLRLVEEIGVFASLCYADINIPNNISPIIHELEELGIEITEEQRIDALQNQRYFIMKEPYPSENWSDVNIRREKVTSNLISKKNEVLSLYRDFVKNVKIELL